MNEVQAILLTGAGFIAANIIGWYLARLANGRWVARNEGAQGERVINIENRIDAMPCQADPKYMVQQGQLLQKVEDIQLRISSIEQHLNAG